MDIKKLCEDSHRQAKEKGWLDTPRPFAAVVGLIHSELSEALEEYRGNRALTEIYYEYSSDGVRPTREYSLEDLEKYQREFGFDPYHPAKPCGIPIELADVIIRIAQHCGTENWDLTGDYHRSGAETINNSFEDLIAICHSDISSAYMSYLTYSVTDHKPTLLRAVYAFATCVHTIESFCEKNGIDLDAAIAEKMAFNATRPYRHGGKKI